MAVLNFLASKASDFYLTMGLPLWIWRLPKPPPQISTAHREAEDERKHNNAYQAGAFGVNHPSRQWRERTRGG